MSVLTVLCPCVGAERGSQKRAPARIVEDSDLTKALELSTGRIYRVGTGEKGELTFVGFKSAVDGAWFSIEGIGGLKRLLSIEPRVYRSPVFAWLSMLTVNGGFEDYTLIGRKENRGGVSSEAVLAGPGGGRIARELTRNFHENALNPVLKEIDGRWSVEFYVRSLKGGVTRILVEGVLNPCELVGWHSVGLVKDGVFPTSDQLM